MKPENRTPNNKRIYGKALKTHNLWEELLIRNASCQSTNELAEFWSSREFAMSFWEKTQAQKSFYDPIITQIPVKPGDCVLDIGAGPGTLAIPLAMKGAKIIAIEPATGMVEVLVENMRTYGIDDLTVYNTRWESVDISDIGHVNHVIACFSLGMQNIRESLARMNEISTETVTLVWFSGRNAWDQMMGGLCSGSCGQTYIDGPKSDLLYTILNQMNIYPDVSHFRKNFFERFESFDDALLQLKSRCRCIYPEKDVHVRKWMKENLISEGAGYLWNPTVTITILSWKKENSSY